MALLFYDGFEGLGNTQVSLRYDVSVSGVSIISGSTNPVPINGRALWSNGNPGVTRCGKLVTPHSSGVFGCRVLPASAVGAVQSIRIFSVYNAVDAVIHLNLRMTSTGVLEVTRGDNTSLGQTASAGYLIAGRWNYVEMKYIIDNTNGGVQVRVDGVDVLKLGAYADTPVTLDTRNGGTSSNVDTLLFGNQTGVSSGTQNNQPAYDDVYVCDLTGSAPYNNFLGEIRVLELIPDGAGDSTDFTPDTGSNWQRVDETPGPDDDTSYVESDTAGDEDLYTMTASSSNAPVILAVKSVTVARKTDAGEQELELLVKSGTTTDASAVQTMTSSFAEYTNTWLQNPDTTADWTLTDVNALQSGFRIPV